MGIQLGFPELDKYRNSLPNYPSPPDAIFPSDNDWGVPLLDLEMQAEMLIAPFVGWGTIKRAARMTGTYHFYVADYRFEAVWKRPEQVIRSGCVACVEPNYSVYTDMARAVAVYNIYRKRWIARWMQTRGVKIIVDLNVAHKHFEVNWLGVPRGWRTYATRAYSDRLAETEVEYDRAAEHAGGGMINFIVYGGGRGAYEMSKTNGWIWYPDQETVKGDKEDG